MIFDRFFGFFSETTLRYVIKFGQKVVHIVPDHLQKICTSKSFPVFEIFSLKNGFFWQLFGPKKIFGSKIFFFIFGIYILQFVKISKKIFDMKISPSEVGQVWHLEIFRKFQKFFLLKSSLNGPIRKVIRLKVIFEDLQKFFSHSEVTQVWHLENFSKISKIFFAQIIS